MCAPMRPCESSLGGLYPAPDYLDSQTVKEYVDFIWIINSGRKICSLRPEFAIGGLRYSKARLIMYKKNSLMKKKNSTVVVNLYVIFGMEMCVIG